MKSRVQELLRTVVFNNLVLVLMSIPLAVLIGVIFTAGYDGSIVWSMYIITSVLISLAMAISHLIRAKTRWRYIYIVLLSSAN